MPPRFCSRQLCFVPIALITVWFLFNFIASFAPDNVLSKDARAAKRMHLIDDIKIERDASNPNVLNVESLADKQLSSKSKSRTTSTSPRSASVQNLFQSAIIKKSLSVSDIRRIVTRINLEQKVLNADKFKPEPGDEVVIVVQVHNRKTYLQYLIDSLRASEGISSALLIFSHDFFDEDINDLIARIDFCRVMQIFYPLSIQLVPDKFPGTDPKDCPPNMPKEQALSLSCQNAYSPDYYGHYRDAKIVQLKHHWWWKANNVFNLKLVRSYKGPVIFLEEDLYVVEDFIPSMKLMYQTTKTQCKNCKILSLAANQDAMSTDRANFRRGSEANVKSQFSNMGLAFTAETWKEMQDCAHVFCRFDDYNWDVTLQHVFTTCMRDAAAMTLSAPRVFHLGSCGTHHTSENCDSTQKIEELKNSIRRNHHPKQLNLQFDVDHRRSNVFYGGWGDARDQGLCLKHVLRI